MGQLWLLWQLPFGYLRYLGEMNIPLTAILVVIIHGYPWCNHGALWHPLQRQVPVMTYTQPGMGITTIEAGKWPSWKDLQNIDMK